ncbi:hypothetical protein MKW92_020187 [Papaver armeniacum]|nr:hypothetical protein MKW92_020187 [Papaver armeniacum]
MKMEMCLDPILIKKWHKMIKKQSKEAEKRGEPFDLLSEYLKENKFVKNLIEEFLEILDSQIFPQKQPDHGDNQLVGSEQVGNGSVLYCETVFSSWCLAKIPGQRGLIFFLKSWSPFLRNRQYQREAINALPLYPNEQMMWDASLVPCMNYHGEGCLALPKLNLQFLTLQDYLLRIFNLFRLESTMMGVPIKEFRIKVIKQPNVGEVKPASVTEDVMFTQDEAAKLTVPERLGLQFVCGGEFIEIRDEEGAILESIRDLMNESCIVPDWLQNIFLGYGNPSAFPRALKGSTHALSGNTNLATDAQNDVHMVDAGSNHSFDFTVLQVGAIISGIQPGLTMVVGSPGTGNTDTAVQILIVLYHNCPVLRTLIITHSNQALNDPFEKIMQLLAEVERLARSLQLPEDMGYTCKTAGCFWLLHVYSRWEHPHLSKRFPFAEYFSNTVQPVFSGQSFEKDMHAAEGCFRHLQTIFQELVAMTCTHAALKRKDFLQLGSLYNNLLMEESAQILEIETSIPMLLQRQEYGYARLKRSILIGDHHQLPLVVKSMAFQKYSHMDQSLFTRFLNAQGRARPNITKLYNWRYRDLGGLPIEREQAIFHTANAGFAYDHQLVDVPDYNGRGESDPSPWFYQNEGEAEYIISVYIYMRLLGYPESKISILTTYNGQKLLIRDVISKRCSHPLIGPPNKVTTVDKFQGQQIDFILLSLVRTHFVGHLRDVRRLIVAMSRARLGIYVFCRRSLFEQCYELQPTFKLLLQRPDQLGLNFDETTSVTERDVGDTGRASFVSGIEEMDSVVDVKMRQAYEAYQVNHS